MIGVVVFVCNFLSFRIDLICTSTAQWMCVWLPNAMLSLRNRWFAPSTQPKSWNSYRPCMRAQLMEHFFPRVTLLRLCLKASVSIRYCWIRNTHCHSHANRLCGTVSNALEISRWFTDGSSVHSKKTRWNEQKEKCESHRLEKPWFDSALFSNLPPKSTYFRFAFPSTHDFFSHFDQFSSEIFTKLSDLIFHLLTKKYTSNRRWKTNALQVRAYQT